MVCPCGHTHWPAAHDELPTLHKFPQVPQLPGSVLVSIQPVPPVVLTQYVCPAGHPQLPLMQLWLGWHELPHVPQLLVSVLVSVHEPLSPPARL